MSGVLYLVATPIGNLGDLSDRARQVLASVDLVAAEDTRRTGQLLHGLGISRPLLSLHEHNERARAAGIVERLQ
ncbi:MAG: SAM-dependent methyltransferase, partial [Steroidobacteraceae bacterium]